MSIERVNIQTPNFSLRASHIRGGQLQNILNAIRRTGAAATTDSSAARLGSSGTGPGAIQSPAERFPQLASPSASGGASGADGAGASSSPSDPSSGFASSGADGMRSLDSNQMMQTIMQLLERLLHAIFQMMGQQGGASGADSGGGAGQGGGCGGGAGSAGGAGGAGGPATCGDGGGMTAMPLNDPTTSGPTNGGGGGGSTPTGTTSTPPRNGNGPACSPGHSGRSRARPHHKPSAIRRILRGIGRGASAAAPLVPGGGAVRAGVNAASHMLGGGDSSTIDRSNGVGGAPTPTKPLASQSGSPSSFLGGGSFEDRLFQFLGSRVKQSEQDLDSAMQQGDSGGGGGQGDSRTLASQRVQQLVQKRSELVETLTNTLKTLHESTQAVTNNLK